MVILKLEKEFLYNKELINKNKSKYNTYNNINNNFISLSKTKSPGIISIKRKAKQDTEYFFLPY